MHKQLSRAAVKHGQKHRQRGLWCDGGCTPQAQRVGQPHMAREADLNTVNRTRQNQAWADVLADVKKSAQSAPCRSWTTAP